MKIFGTGFAGFLGSHAVDLMLSQGHEVTAYDNLVSGRTERVTRHHGIKMRGRIVGTQSGMIPARESHFPLCPAACAMINASMKICTATAGFV